MNTTKQESALYVRKVRGMGRGVFAGRAYRKGEVIEVCPVIRVTPGADGTADGGLEYYVFQWDKGALAVALGYGSLYNHSPEANAKFTPRHARNDIVFKATRDISVGEQIFIDYQWDEGDYATFR